MTVATTQAELDKALATTTSDVIFIRAENRLRLTVGPTGEHKVYLEGGTVQEVYSGGTVQRVSSGGTVQRVSSGGTVQEVSSGGTVQRVYSGGTVQEVSSGGTVQRVSSGGTVQEANGASVIVRAEGSAVIAKAGPLATVYVYSAKVTVGGGRVIDMTAINELDPATWCEFNGVDVEDGEAILYKAVDDNLQSGRGFEYTIGESVTCSDWTDNNDCGGGLHVSPTPVIARAYFPWATRFLEVRVPLEGVRPILGSDPKVKFKTGRVVREVTTARDAVAA